MADLCEQARPLIEDSFREAGMKLITIVDASDEKYRRVVGIGVKPNGDSYFSTVRIPVTPE